MKSNSKGHNNVQSNNNGWGALAAQILKPGASIDLVATNNGDRHVAYSNQYADGLSPAEVLAAQKAAQKVDQEHTNHSKTPVASLLAKGPSATKSSQRQTR